MYIHIHIYIHVYIHIHIYKYLFIHAHTYRNSCADITALWHHTNPTHHLGPNHRCFGLYYYNRLTTNFPHYVSTRWARAGDHSHEHTSTAKTLQTGAIASPHVLAVASAAGKPDRQARLTQAWVKSKLTNPVVSRPSRLHTSEIPKALSVRSALTPPLRFLTALLDKFRKLSETHSDSGREN